MTSDIGDDDVDEEDRTNDIACRPPHTRRMASITNEVYNIIFILFLIFDTDFGRYRCMRCMKRLDGGISLGTESGSTVAVVVVVVVVVANSIVRLIPAILVDTRIEEDGLCWRG